MSVSCWIQVSIYLYFLICGWITPQAFYRIRSCGWTHQCRNGSSSLDDLLPKYLWQRPWNIGHHLHCLIESKTIQLRDQEDTRLLFSQDDGSCLLAKHTLRIHKISQFLQMYSDLNIFYCINAYYTNGLITSSFNVRGSHRVVKKTSRLKSLGGFGELHFERWSQKCTIVG